MNRNRWQCATLFALAVCLMTTPGLTAPQHPVLTWDLSPNGILLLYDPSSGSLQVHVRPEPLTTLELRSAAGLFVPEKSTFFPPRFPDVTTPQKLFHLDTEGFGEDGVFNIGHVLPVGLSDPRVLAADLLVDGSYKTGGNLQKYGGGPYLFGPEPSGVVLFGSALLALLLGGRKWDWR